MGRVCEIISEGLGEFYGKCILRGRVFVNRNAFVKRMSCLRDCSLGWDGEEGGRKLLRSPRRGVLFYRDSRLVECLGFFLVYWVSFILNV